MQSYVSWHAETAIAPHGFAARPACTCGAIAVTLKSSAVIPKSIAVTLKSIAVTLKSSAVTLKSDLQQTYQCIKCNDCLESAACSAPNSQHSLF